MPTLEISKSDRESLCGKKFSPAELEEALLCVKGELELVEGDRLRVDVKETNRPDFWSTEGIARQVKGFLGKEKGLPKFSVKKGRVEIIVDKSVEKIRPKIAGAVVWDVKVTKELLEQMIQLQEKVTLTFGRRRKEAAIGLYDFDKMKPPIHYKAFHPRKLKFTPLDFKNELGLDEILELHPKGREYAHLLKDFPAYPIVIDSAKNVASMPPIINSDFTGKVTENTRNLFVEVTGSDQNTVNVALCVMVAALADRKGIVESVSVKYGNKKIVTPDFSPKKILVGLDYINDISGLELSQTQAIDLLKKSRVDAKPKGKSIEVSYPSFRQDVLHPVDVAEDIIVAFGYNKINPLPVNVPTIGGERQEAKLHEIAREICVGLCLQEVLTFTLTSREKQEKIMGLKGESFSEKLAKEAMGESFVEILNPVSENWAVYRKMLVPELLDFLAKNKNVEYPQRIFEIGKVVSENPENDNGIEEKNVLCVAIAGRKTNFTEIKSLLEAVCSNLGVKCRLAESQRGFLKKGMSAEIMVEGKKGFLGEVSEETLKAFGLEMPVTVLEMEI